MNVACYHMKFNVYLVKNMNLSTLHELYMKSHEIQLVTCENMNLSYLHEHNLQSTENQGLLTEKYKSEFTA